MSASEFAAKAGPLAISNVDVFVYRAPVDTPVQTSFGLMRDRSAVLVRVKDKDGVEGWGEVWCNFPTVGAEHRARLLIDSVAPLVLGQAWPNPAACFESLTRRLHVLAVQSGEPGPVAQAIAGVDIALWDLFSKRAGQPLWRLLGGQSESVAVYASGLNPTEPQRLAERRAAEGYRAFKLKVGFGESRDIGNLRALRTALGEDATLMTDANQAWNLEEACRMSERLAEYRPIWLEEPIGADLPVESWIELAKRSSIPLAAGENFRGDSQFDEFIRSGAIRIVQPDAAKWGGFTRCVALGRRVNEHQAWFCPHWLGGGIGLAASLQLKAAVGGPGYVEVDANPNPLREQLLESSFEVTDGAIRLPKQNGLGIEPDLKGAERFLACALSSDSRDV
jgi:L-alanine-DL-glutamate epimerase-like enolase superfamily enzyme